MPKTGVTPTRGERLLIARRREKLSQESAAAQYGVSVDTYRDWEMDVRTKDVPHVQVGHLKAHEICFLFRRRAGQTQRQIAVAMNCTRLWVVQMERGEVPADRLREYWGV